MIRLLVVVFFYFTLVGCHPSENKIAPSATVEKDDSKEITNFYSSPKTEMVFSTAVSDSFKIFSSLPREYQRDTTTHYPLILVLDANGYFESVVAELKLNTLTQDLPKSVVVGIGYDSFWALDSLRDRDYTYPKAAPADSFRISGGADKFKIFIDKELLPRVINKYRIDKTRIILMGHSLGGYFALYHLFHSTDENEYGINRYIAVSPSLAYGDQYILKLEPKFTSNEKRTTGKLYVSIGSLENDPNEENLFFKLKTKLAKSGYHPADLKFVEFGNFDHMDSAMPGFMKGLSFVLVE